MKKNKRFRIFEDDFDRLYLIIFFSGFIVIVFIVIFSMNMTDNFQAFIFRISDKKRLYLSGSDNVTVRGKTCSSEHDIINVGGNAKITLIDCHFKAPTPIVVVGGASLTMIGGSLEATENGIFSAGGPKNITLKNVTIISSEDGIEFYGKELHALVENCTIKAERTAITSFHGATVTIRGGTITGESLALKATHRGSIFHDNKVKILGDMETSGTAKIKIIEK